MKEAFLKPEAASAVSPVPNGPRPTRSARVAAETALSASEAGSTSRPRQILRFRRSERVLHWSIAIPFMACYATGLILMVFYNLHSQPPSRDVFSWLHRIAGACLIVFPILTAVRNRNDYRIHLYNVKQAWTWAIDDLKWLVLMGAAAVNSRVSLPEQGKFNAGEKLNFMMVMCTYPLFIATGLVLWMPGIAFLSWVVHVALAAVATPLMLGHIYMATINPSTRVGLGGMFSGYVDRQWAKHHYRRWYRENFEDDERADGERAEARQALRRPALIRCPSCCAEHLAASWARVLETVFEVQPLPCPSCGADADTVTVIVEPGEVDWVLRCLEQAGVGSRVERSLDAGLPRGTDAA